MNAIPFSSTRLAPSPTGALHLGHARTFLVTWWLARQAGAKIFMRMEDLDAGRARPESVQQAYDDLRWLGMDWDAWSASGPGEKSHGTTGAVREADVDHGAVVQSRRVDVYDAVLEQLWRRGAIYPCTCTRAQIAASVEAAASAPHEGEANVRYPGTCRSRSKDPKLQSQSIRQVMKSVHDESGKTICWRLRVPAGPESFEDLMAGHQTFDVAAETGDFPLTRFATGSESSIPPAYQLACVVDDHAMGVDLVIRGDDLLSSTPRQLLIYRALAWTPPKFLHLPLIVGPDGKRLAKRHGESRIAQFRAAGVSAERITGWAAWRSGQIEHPVPLAAEDLVQRFQLSRMPPNRLILQPSDLQWLR